MTSVVKVEVRELYVSFGPRTRWLWILSTVMKFEVWECWLDLSNVRYTSV